MSNHKLNQTQRDKVTALYRKGWSEERIKKYVKFAWDISVGHNILTDLRPLSMKVKKAYLRA